MTETFLMAYNDYANTIYSFNFSLLNKQRIVILIFLHSFLTHLYHNAHKVTYFFVHSFFRVVKMSNIYVN